MWLKSQPRGKAASVCHKLQARSRISAIGLSRGTGWSHAPHGAPPGDQNRCDAGEGLLTAMNPAEA